MMHAKTVRIARRTVPTRVLTNRAQERVNHNLIPIDLTASEAEFVEARRNPLSQRDADPSIVRRARIPDSCGARTAVMRLINQFSFAVGASTDAVVIQPILPLTGSASTTHMPATYKNGGCVVIAATNGEFTTGAFTAFSPWEGHAKFISNLSFTKNGVSLLAPYRVVGYGINVKSSDPENSRRGRYRGGTIEMPVPTTTPTNGGWTVGHCGTAASRHYSFMDVVSCMAEKDYAPEEGITVRAHFDRHQHDDFHEPAVVPTFIESTGGLSHDCDWSGRNNLTSAPLGGDRNFVPTVVIESTTAACTYSVKVALTIEVDLSNMPMSTDLNSEVSPYSARYELLKWLCNNPSVYPDVTSGNSFWTTVKELGNGLYRIGVPAFAAVASSGLLGPKMVPIGIAARALPQGSNDKQRRKKVKKNKA